MNTDLQFAYKVRQALNEGTDNLPASSLDRLASARKQALSHKKQSSGLLRLARRGLLAGQSAGQAVFDAPFSWMGRMGVVAPILLVAAGLIGIFQYEQQQRISDLAEIDALVLADELPLDAYLDHGFNAYLTEQQPVQ
jgi:hypothetical protein